MSREIVTESELKKAFGIGTRPALTRYLVSMGIPYKQTPKGMIWTVQKAVDQAVLANELTDNYSDWDFVDAS